jgi:hypothetical protein
MSKLNPKTHLLHSTKRRFFRDGYDQEGYDRNGFDRDGYNRDGLDRDGYNRDGFDRAGDDRDGINQDRDGINQDDVEVVYRPTPGFPTSEAAVAHHDKKITESNENIRSAIEVLSGSHRGLKVLHALKEFLGTEAIQGLDAQGCGALRDLVTEFCDNHRRGFLPAFNS